MLTGQIKKFLETQDLNILKNVSTIELREWVNVLNTFGSSIRKSKKIIQGEITKRITSKKVSKIFLEMSETEKKIMKELLSNGN